MKRHFKLHLFIFLLFFALAGCVNLEEVNKFSLTSLKSVETLKDQSYTYKQFCIDKCKEKNIAAFVTEPVACDCVKEKTIDSTLLIALNTIDLYFRALQNLSSKDLTAYKTDKLEKAINDNGGNKSQVEGIAALGRAALNLCADGYRMRKLKTYMPKADTAFQKVIPNLELYYTGFSKNIDDERRANNANFKNYIADSKNSAYERARATRDYTEYNQTIDAQKKALDVEFKALKTIVSGHKQLTSNLNKLKKDDVKAIMDRYADDIKTIMSELKKLKK